MADGMYTLPDPRDPNVVYYNGHFGDITRIDMRNAEERYIQPYPVGPAGGGADRESYRFNWNSPVHMSPSDPDVVYYGGNVLFKTTDGGSSWTVISPDLTTNDPEKQKASGGEITPDNTRAEFHCTILSIAESPRDRSVIWAGTDDGNLQLTRDGGKTWANVAPNIAGAPRFSWIASVQASHADAGAAYVAIDQHRLDDFAPYAFVTTDHGRTWRSIAAGLRGYVHIVIEDPKQPSLLYAGTELGIFASFDRGANWTDLRLGLPPLAVVDMKVHPRDNDLVIATHARGFYILDDATPLQRLAEARSRTLALFEPRPATRYTPASDTSVLGNRAWVARNKPYGAALSYYVAEAGSAGGAQLEIRDSGGRVVQTLSGPQRPGVNRVVWNLTEASSCQAGAGSPAPGARGRRGGTWLRALPGDYTVRLTASGGTVDQPLRVRLDPRVQASKEDLNVWYREARKIERMECRIAQAAERARTLDDRLAERERQATGAELRAEAAAVRKDLGAILVGLAGNPRDSEHLNLRGRVNWLTIQVGNYSGRPTGAQIEWIAKFEELAEGLLQRLDGVTRGSLARLNAKLRAAGLLEIG
jgi:hypothetical protein